MSRAPNETARALLSHASAAAILSVYFVLGVALSAKLADGRPPRELRTPLDDAIPFLPWTVLLYSWVYTSALYPIFVVRSRAIFRRIVLAYAVVMTVSFATFVVFPVTSLHLRADPATLDPEVFVDWAMRLTYAIDPPYNLFPSMHLSIAAIAALSAGAASRRYGLYAAPVVVAIAVTITTTKQHFIADGIGGLALALATYAVVFRGLVREDERSATYGLPGALAYLAYHAAFYGAFYLAFRLGLRVG